MMISDSCAACGVRSRSLCGALDDDAVAALNRIGRHRRLAAGETLVWAGDDSRICGNLLTGVLKLSASTADGREQTVGLLYPADFVGRPFGNANAFSVCALTDAELCMFPRHPFEELLAENGDMERELLRRTFAALDEARVRMLMLVRQSAEEKIANFLLDMADRSDSSGCRAIADGPLTFDLPLNRGQIADVLGLTIETVSRQMTKLKVAGIVALPGVRTVTIRDWPALRARAQVG